MIPLLACAPEETAPPDTGDRADYSTDDVEMIALEAGSFAMGADDFAPIHTVTLTHPFWMNRTEALQGRWEARMGENPSFFPGCDDCPVEQTSWIDCALYANAVSTAEGLPPCFEEDGSELVAELVADPYACEGYRLPTEAEWEYAARAGEDTVYAGSDDVDAVSWYTDNSGDAPHPAAQLAPNAWGLYDMSGNVWEWTSDHYTFYADGDVTDPVPATTDPYRLNRGGGYNGDANVSRVVYRGARGSDFFAQNLGCRLVRTRPLTAR